MLLSLQGPKGGKFHTSHVTSTLQQSHHMLLLLSHICFSCGNAEGIFLQLCFSVSSIRCGPCYTHCCCVLFYCFPCWVVMAQKELLGGRRQLCCRHFVYVGTGAHQVIPMRRAIPDRSSCACWILRHSKLKYYLCWVSTLPVLRCQVPVACDVKEPWKEPGLASLLTTGKPKIVEWQGEGSQYTGTAVT